MVTLTRRAAIGISSAFLAPLAFPSISSAEPAPAPDFARLDGIAQAELVRKREVSALELVDTAIRRVEVLNPKLNAVVATFFEQARKKASEIVPGLPFAGVPSLVKGLDDYAGTVNTFGSRLYADNVSKTTEPLLAAYDRQGIIFIGKSNAPEYGLLPTTEPLLYGPCRNPWNLGRSVGGSSGGAAAAVASGMVPFAHANDIGGSIRIPASCCGVFGLKPSYGRMELGYQGPSAVMVADHVETRSVRDSALLFALTEASGKDAMFTPIGYVKGASKRRLKIAFTVLNNEGKEPEPDVKAAVEWTARLCTDLGHQVVPVAYPLDQHQVAAIKDAFLALIASDAAELVKTARRKGLPPASVLEPWTLGLADKFSALAPGATEKALATRKEMIAQADRFFAKYDAWLTPVVSSAPPKIGFLAPDQPFETLLQRVLRYTSYTSLHNFVGTPAMSVPLTWNDGGLPIGSQFSTGRGGERTLFHLAYELEAARPWATRYPPVFAG